MPGKNHSNLPGNVTTLHKSTVLKANLVAQVNSFNNSLPWRVYSGMLATLARDIRAESNHQRPIPNAGFCRQFRPCWLMDARFFLVCTTARDITPRNLHATMLMSPP